MWCLRCTLFCQRHLWPFLFAFAALQMILLLHCLSITLKLYSIAILKSTLLRVNMYFVLSWRAIDNCGYCSIFCCGCIHIEVGISVKLLFIVYFVCCWVRRKLYPGLSLAMRFTALMLKFLNGMYFFFLVFRIWYVNSKTLDFNYINKILVICTTINT